MIRVTAVSCLLAGPAQALSCLPADVALSYSFAAEAEATYVVLWGELTFTPLPLPPQPDDPNQPIPPKAVQAILTGMSLTSNGFSRPFDGPVLLDPVCWGPWCGGYPRAGVETVLFALQEDDRIRVELVPCGSTLHPNPAAEDIRRIETCHQGGPCDPAPGHR